LREELARKDQELKKAYFRQDDLRQKVDREKRINFNLTAELQKVQAKNQPDLPIPRNVPLALGSLGAIRNTNSVLDGLDDQAREDYERSKAERNARKTLRDGGQIQLTQGEAINFFTRAQQIKLEMTLEGETKHLEGVCRQVIEVLQKALVLEPELTGLE